MSQNTTPNEKVAGAAAGKKLLCKTFTEQNISALLDPQWVLLQLQTSGIQYQPQSYMALQARAIQIEDIKLFIANYFKANDIDIETDESVAKQINTWFESAIIKTNPYLAVQSGAISQERIQELMSSGFGFNPFGFGGGQMQMPGFGQMNPFAAQQQVPAWNKKADTAQKTKQQPQAFNPFGFGGQMGFPGMSPMGGMGMMGGGQMGFGFPGVGMGGI